MSDDKELTARLRDFEKVTVGDARDAADRIEALTAKVKLMYDLDAINGEKIEALEAKLATCEKYRDAYAECDRIGTQAVRDLEAKLAKAEAGLLAIAKRDEQMIWGEDYEVEEAFKDMRDISCATLAAVSETHKIMSG
jgi:hypothetical protein